jgi:hypothetical protein
MSECDRLIGVVQSLTGMLEATRSKPMLHQLVSMALVEAAEDLVRGGFEPARLCEFGVIEELACLLDAERRSRPEAGAPSTPTPGRGVPYLRLVGS